MPAASVISETSRNFIPMPKEPFKTKIPSALPVEYPQPQVIQPTAPRMDEDSAPKYESPPNYDEAMEMINQQMYYMPVLEAYIASQHLKATEHWTF